MARKPDVTPADRAKLVRLFLHKELDRLLREITAPKFSGGFSMELSSKDGRPGEPICNLRRYGLAEME